jgi:hypothetical protein
MQTEHLFTCPPSPVPGQQSPAVHSTLPSFQSSNLQPIIVPQATNLERPPITHNRRRKLALKSQSYLFLEKDFFKFFYSKIPNHHATLGLPSPVSRPSPSSRAHCHSSAPKVQTCQRSNVPTLQPSDVYASNVQPAAIVPRLWKFKNNSIQMPNSLNPLAPNHFAQSTITDQKSTIPSA